MEDSNRRFWPYPAIISIIITILFLAVLLFVFLVLRENINWPGANSETAVLTGIFLLSLLPILFCLMDAIIVNRGVIKYGGLEIDFSKVTQAGVSVFPVPVNIGVPGKPIYDKNTFEILDTLKQATKSEIVIIDLEDGDAWWETRLFVLLAGAVRLKNPKIVVFIGKENNIDRCFQGWGYSEELFQNLLKVDTQYQMSYHKAMSAARKWELVEPVGPGKVPKLISQGQGLAKLHQAWAFDILSGIPNKLFAERLLANELGNELERTSQFKMINLNRLKDRFDTILYKDCIDEAWSTEQKNEKFFSSDSVYVAVTQNNRYSHLVSRLTVLNAVVRTLVEKK